MDTTCDPTLDPMGHPARSLIVSPRLMEALVSGDANEIHNLCVGNELDLDVDDSTVSVDTTRALKRKMHAGKESRRLWKMLRKKPQDVSFRTVIETWVATMELV